MSLFKKSIKSPAPKTETGGERWQLTVLFYDIVGSTSLAEAGDAEALKAVLSDIHERAREIVIAHGGSVEQVMGDGGMAYFGFPNASEDAALRSVEAALDLLAARGDIAGAPDMRLGLATSVVVLPDRPDALAGGRLGAVGVAPNLAARLESAAPVNQILVSPATFALTRRAVDYEPVSDLTLKGFPDVTLAFRPVSVRDTETRFLRDRDQSLSLTGRAAELEKLRYGWSEAADGTGRAFLIEGEPGIGKSHLVAALAEGIGHGRAVVLQCQPGTQGDALYPVIRMYERGYEAGLDPELMSAAERTAERLAVLEDDETLSADQLRFAIVQAVVDILLELARTTPLLLIAEDLHWADEVTLAVLEGLATRLATRPLMILGTARPDKGLEPLLELVTHMPLTHIAPRDAAFLIQSTADIALKPDTRDWIANKADGNPLFLIELTRYAADFVATGGDPAALSGAEVGSLRDLLATRLESAGQAKRTAQVSSVLGREYPHHLLARLHKNLDPIELDTDLQRLVDHGLQAAINNGYAYTFQHALIRDVAYDSQLRAVRKRLHGEVVDIVDADPSLAGDVPDILLAEHCMAAERTERGLNLLLSVAEDAIRRSALKAPRKMLERVLKEAGALPEGPDRDLIELRAILLLGPLVSLLDSHRAAGPLYERGQDIYFRLEEPVRAPFFPILWGWWFTSTDIIEQTRRSEILIRDVKPDADPESRLQALHCGWASLFDGGAHDRCLHAIEDGLALFDPEVAQHSRYLYGHDAKVCGLGERALCQWFTGDLDASARAIRDCEAFADETGQLASQLHGLDVAMQLAVFNQNLPEIDRILTRIEALDQTDAAPAIAAKRKIFGGWIASKRGDASKLGAVTAGLADLRKLGVVEDTPHYVDIAAEVAAAAGKPFDALGPLEDEIAASLTSGLTYWLPELLRRKALLTAGPAAQAALDEGFDIAFGQNAQMLVLRNVATRLDLGLAVPKALRDQTAERIERVTDCALRQKVWDGLKL